MNPLDYSLCCQTVTLYRRQGDSITRQVLEGCYLAGQCSSPTESYGKSRLKKFLLIIPGDRPIACGDRIYEGIGPEEVDWKLFLPAAVSQLYEVGSVRACRWEGEIVHWEAGEERRWH